MKTLLLIFLVLSLQSCTTIDRREYFSGEKNPEYFEVTDSSDFDWQAVAIQTEHPEKALNLRGVRFKITNALVRTLFTGIILPVFPYFEKPEHFRQGELLQLEVTGYATTRGMRGAESLDPSFLDLSIKASDGKVYRSKTSGKYYNTLTFVFDVEVKKLKWVIVDPLTVKFADGITMQTKPVKFRRVRRTGLKDHPVAP